MGFVDIIWNFGFHYVQLVTGREACYLHLIFLRWKCVYPLRFPVMIPL